MKVCIVQPPYYTDTSKADECFAWEMSAMDRCDETLDLIVLPETCDVPSYTDGDTGNYDYIIVLK